MRDAQLNFGFRVDCVNGFQKAAEAVHSGDKNIFEATLLKLGENRQPEFCTFVLAQTQTQQILLALHVDAQRLVDRLIDNPLVLANLDHDAFQVHDGLDLIQWTCLPFPDSLHHLLGDLGNERW